MCKMQYVTQVDPQIDPRYPVKRSAMQCQFLGKPSLYLQQVISLTENKLVALSLSHNIPFR